MAVIVLSTGPGGGLCRTPAGVDGAARIEIMSFSDDIPALPERPRQPDRVPPYRLTPG